MTSSDTIKVYLFAHLKDKAGCSELEIKIDSPLRIAALKTQIEKQCLNLAGSLNTSIASVNKEFAFEDDIVQAGDEVAFFPPVSGGSVGNTYCKITTDVLSMDELAKMITYPTTGAVCYFSGVVRGETSRDRQFTTASLEYEAYIPMAELKMNLVAEEIRQRWPAVEGIVIVQRIGHLEPGTPTVAIAVSAAHRDTGVFEAARYGIDRLKEIVPIWKKEIGPDGASWIEGKYIPTSTDRK
ncbi:MAG: molybdopterin converting factor [Anaerolineaceae bacterium]|nr:molybdopterin converting factor [Anaerolineaceae bacterium]